LITCFYLCYFSQDKNISFAEPWPHHLQGQKRDRIKKKYFYFYCIFTLREYKQKIRVRSQTQIIFFSGAGVTSTWCGSATRKNIAVNVHYQVDKCG
jgi:hypothetical protein